MLHGIAVRFYLSIGNVDQYISPFSRVNLFIGANNSGKSVILNLLSSQVSKISRNEVPSQISGTDIYRGGKTGTFLYALGFSAAQSIENIVSQHQGKPFQNNVN